MSATNPIKNVSITENREMGDGISPFSWQAMNRNVGKLAEGIAGLSYTNHRHQTSTSLMSHRCEKACVMVVGQTNLNFMRT